MRLTSRGRMAETRYRIAERFRHHTLLLLEPVTGRTHQLRLHAVCLGCPILGDALYGHGPGLFLSTLKARFKPGRHEERPLIAHLALHAAKLTFRHPGTGAETTISTPLPREMEVALRNLRRFAPG
jgi:23S rRNA-/tRNA-specific pseudouridylate synthase